MRIVCWQTILMKHHTLFFRKLGKMSQNLSSAAVVIVALRVNLSEFTDGFTFSEHNNHSVVLLWNGILQEFYNSGI